MSSTLKILVDIQCLIYCDFEEVGEALPGTIFKMELHKGVYVIDFRKEGIVLKSIKYKIESDEEDYFLEESLVKIYTKEKEKRRRRGISEKEVLWIDNGDHWRILSLNNDILNPETGESWIDLPNNYNLLPMGQHHDSDVDACGYIPFNIGGKLMKKDDSAGFVISGGQWGCLDKSGKVVIQPVYGRKVFFQNNQVTSTWDSSVIAHGLIDNFGEKVFTKFDCVFPIDEVAGYYDVSQEKKHGIINKYGEIILPLTYLEFGYHTSKAIWARDSSSNKWGLIRFDSTIVLPFIYDKVKEAKDGFFVCKSERWGVVDFEGRIIVDTQYRIVTKVTKSFYDSNDTSEDLKYTYCYYSIVVLDEYERRKYGIVNTHFDSYTETLLSFKEIVPCKYDAIYSEWGTSYTEDALVKAASSPYGCFEITDMYFVIKQDHIQCDRYDDEGNITYSFICDEFNSEYKILSQKYYRRIADSKFDNNPYDIMKSIDFYDGTIRQGWIPDDDDDNAGHIIYERFKIDYLIGKKDAEWHVFAADFACKCDKIVEFGYLCCGEEYFAIVEIGNRNKLFIIDGAKIVYESDYMMEIHSSYNELANSKRVVNEYRSLDHDYFIVRLNLEKWQIFRYDSRCASDYGVDIFKSSEFDFIRFINEYSVEVQVCHNGHTLYNTISIDYGYNMEPKSIRWKVSPYEERNCNWVAVYDFETGKEGVVIEEHCELSEEGDFCDPYGDIRISRIPEEIIIPFEWDYARVFYSERNSIIAVGNYTSDKVGDLQGATNELRCAIMDTRKHFLSQFIFDRITTGSSCQQLSFYIGKFMADINLVQDDIIYSIPFLNYESSDKDGKRLKGSPFKNVRLFIDTETTGLPLNDKATYTNLDNWPYLVQVALIIEDDNYGILARRNIILKPDGYSIPESSAKIHGISNTKALKEGEDRKQVIGFLDLVLCNSNIIIGHNVSFDLNMIKAEIIRVKGKENALFVKQKHDIIDTMNLGVDICKIPNLSCYSSQNQSYKYPKLDELYYKLFNEHFGNQHDAMADIQATYDCYYELKKSE